MKIQSKENSMRGNKNKIQETDIRTGALVFLLFFDYIMCPLKVSIIYTLMKASQMSTSADSLAH